MRLDEVAQHADVQMSFFQTEVADQAGIGGGTDQPLAESS